MARRPRSALIHISVTVEDVIREILPFGCNPDEPGLRAENLDWALAPLWAPDAFAVVATLAERSGFYAEPGIALSTTPRGRDRKRTRAKEAEEWGAAWGTNGVPPSEVLDLWTELWRGRSEPVCDGAGNGRLWKEIAMRLLATADEACAGVGYEPPLLKGGDTSFGNAALVFEEYRYAAPSTPRMLRSSGFLPYLPNSLARAVPPDRACVLPKALTPSVGCTLRSVTHNLALLPGKGQVGAEWRLTRSWSAGKDLGGKAIEPDPHFNLLLVPFPYEIAASDLPVYRQSDGDDVDGYFTVQPGWLPPGSATTQVAKLVSFIVALVQAAENDGGVVHGVVLPETALTEEIVGRVADGVARRCRGLEIFIAGIIAAAPRRPRGTEPPFGRNEVFVARFDDRERLDEYRQAKHHRWRLDGSQIKNYRLGHTLDARKGWWEAIDLSDRRMVFGLDARQAVIAALICEDLARYDPVLPVLASVGPNLVIALLMDGPQLGGRWPGRHATVLAEDPGSAVLTLTSAGMVQRSTPPKGVAPRRCVALWTERGSSPQELDLDAGDHALFLALTAQSRKQNTLDLRRQRDSGGLIEYQLSGHTSVKLPDSSQFLWLQRRSVGSRVRKV